MCESLIPLLPCKLIWVRKELSSSYKPKSFASLLAISTPIFSKEDSSTVHEGWISFLLHLSHTFLNRFRKKLNSEDFPLPVGIPTVIHKITGSTHCVPSTSTTECASKKLTSISRPLRTDVGGILIALPTNVQHCKDVPCGILRTPSHTNLRGHPMWDPPDTKSHQS